MKKPLISFSILVFGLSIAFPGQAQSSADSAALESVLTQALSLTEREEKVFLPAYRHYQQELEQLQQRYPLMQYGSFTPPLSEEVAWLYLESAKRYKQRKARVEKRLGRRLGKGLPYSKTAYFFRLEQLSPDTQMKTTQEVQGSIPLTVE